MSKETLFHKILTGEIPCHKVWEDEEHLAFLSIFPNTEGVTVVIPKKWQPSNFAEASPKVMADLVVAAQKVARLIERNMKDVGRVGLVIEGLGVDYLHIKLFPMHGVDEFVGDNEQARTEYYDRYPGYLSSHDAAQSDDEILAGIAKKIRGE